MRIATVDGVQQGIIACTIAQEARGLPLMGQYVVIRLGSELLLGRMGTINLSNPIHQDPAFKPYLMVHGRVDQWSKDVDIEESTIQVIGMIDEESRKIPQQTNPSTGTDIESALEEDIVRFRNEGVYLLTIGAIPNARGLSATIVNRHHGSYETGGYGEARHCGVFGQNGSGKTVFALQLLVGKLAAHHDMGLLMPDTAGDLSDPTRHNRGDFQWNYLDVLHEAGVHLDVLDIGDIRLTSRGTLKQLFQPVLARHCNMQGDKATTLASLIVESLFDGDVDCAQLTADQILHAIIAEIGHVYATQSQRTKVTEAEQLRDNIGRRRPFERELAGVQRFFDGRECLDDLIRDILLHGRKVIIRMDDRHITEREQGYVMHELMRHLTRRAQIVFKSENRSCNALVVLDEGARWVPEGQKDEGDIGLVVERAFRETRKYGLGWMVISQRMSDVSKAVLTQAHTKWFGRGVGVGNDRRHLEDHLGKEGLEAYDRLELQGGFFWVGTGQDNNLGTEGNYFTVHPFGGDATRAFIDANPSLFRRRF